MNTNSPIDNLTISELNEHPPFPLSNDKILEYQKLLVQIQERIDIATLAQQSANDLLQDKVCGKGYFHCVVTDPEYITAKKTVELSLKDAKFALRRFKIFDKKIRIILLENDIFVNRNLQQGHVLP